MVASDWPGATHNYLHRRSRNPRQSHWLHSSSEIDNGKLQKTTDCSMQVYKGAFIREYSMPVIFLKETKGLQVHIKSKFLYIEHWLHKVMELTAFWPSQLCLLVCQSTHLYLHDHFSLLCWKMCFVEQEVHLPVCMREVSETAKPPNMSKI